MKFEKRDYQIECANSWLDAFEYDCSPLIAVPTGAGKTVILCTFIYKWLEKNPEDNILILSHTQEIIKQDYDALLEYFPSFGVGIYQAGLGRKDIKKITVAGIHSIYKIPEKFKDFKIAIVDEAHTVNHKAKGMYRSFFKATGLQVGGMTATIFRTGYGYIHKGSNPLFNHVAYDLTSFSNFNKLVSKGYLTKLISKATEFELDSSNVRKTAGEYNIKDLSETHNRESITRKAVAEAVKFGKNYKKWLVFAINTEHASNICQEFRSHGIKTEELHTNMEGDREEIIDSFKYGSTRCLVSVGMVTTGFDAPNVDLIILLRPTLSPVLHVQMVGRGLRVYPGKEHCLVLDFAGNTMRLGPINNPVIKKKGKKKGSKEKVVPAKKCPVCKVYTFIMAKYCDVCNHEFIFQTSAYDKLTSKPGTAEIVQKENDWIAVDDVKYFIHYKAGKPPSLRVTYICGSNTYNEWVCLNHQGYSKQRADKWVKRRYPTCSLYTTENVYLNSKFLSKPKSIQVKRGKYVNVTNARF